MSSTSWQSILVGVGDPGGRKQIAIRKAARIAAICGARITLFHAFSLPSPVTDAIPSDATALLRAAAKQRREQLLRLARPLRARGITVQCEAVWDFPPAHAIVRHVLDTKPDLVVAESHRHSRVARWFLANSDWDLIRECPCPVWFVKQERLPKKPLVMAAVDPTHAHAKPSGLDDRLLQATRVAAAQLGGRIEVIHVRDSRGDTPARRGRTRESKSVPEVGIEAIEHLAHRHGIEAANTLLRAGVPADVLADSAAERKVDLLVMGAVSRSGSSLSHIGSTTEAVIDRVGCDVLVVKPRRFKTAVRRKPATLPNAYK